AATAALAEPGHEAPAARHAVAHVQEALLGGRAKRPEHRRARLPEADPANAAVGGAAGHPAAIEALAARPAARTTRGVGVVLRRLGRAARVGRHRVVD